MKNNIKQKILTVIIRNDGPLIFCNDSPSYRSIHIPLTKDQLNMIDLKVIGKNNGIDIYEKISNCFIEEK